MERAEKLLRALAGDLASLADRPSRKIPLSEISGDVEIRTITGKPLVLSYRDACQMKRDLPGHLHARAMLPIELILEPRGENRLRIMGSIWDKRIVHYLTHGKLLWRPPEEILVEEARKIIQRYTTLVHLMIAGDRL